MLTLTSPWEGNAHSAPPGQVTVKTVEWGGQDSNQDLSDAKPISLTTSTELPPVKPTVGPEKAFLVKTVRNREIGNETKIQ